METVSVLIPVYNVEKYLAICLDSILAQTYPQIEMILINDGSTDGSKEIAEKYAASHKNIFLYNYENAGISTTRNRALDHATGTYLTFVDSDDWIDPEMIGSMVAAMNSCKADIVLCGYRMDYFKYFPLLRKVAGKQTMTGIEAIHKLVENKGVNNYPWAKLYKADTFRNVRFPAHATGFEDTRTIYKTFLNAKKIAAIPNRYYHYVQHSGSLTNNMSLSFVYNMRKAYHDQEEELKKALPGETFDYAINYYNTDMVIIYTLIFITKRKEDPVFVPDHIDWSRLSWILKAAYGAWLQIACWKYGWKKKELDWK